MDTDKEWDTVPAKTDKIKISSNENIYILSELIDNGACLRCLSNHCHLTEKHGIFIPDKIKIFIKNPLYISEIKKLIDNEKNIMQDIDETNQITPIFTTCGFTHSKKGCRNCIDGRMKTLYLNTEPLIICYSQIKPGMSKITFGLHINIKLILKDKNYQVSAIPVNIILPEHTMQMQIPIDMNEQSIRMDNKNEFPNLEKSELVEKKTIVLSEKSVWNNKLKIVPEIISDLESSSNSNLESKLELEIMDEHKVTQNIQKLPSNVDFNNINLILIKENNDLKMENNELKETLQKLEKKISHLNEKIYKNDYINKNSKKYEEIITNLTTINNVVVEQFLDTNYSEYILY